MAIIKRLNITEFKVVSIFSEPGVLEESTGNSWVLDRKGTDKPFGTEDFDGVARTSVLLARLESISIDTGNLPVNQFQQLPPNALVGYQPLVQNIGWMELGRSVASIYYEDCVEVLSTDPITNTEMINPGRLPVSKNYFDMDDLQILRGVNQTIPIVSGEGFGPQALQIIQMYNPNVGMRPGDVWSFGPNPLNFPGMPLIGPNDYVRMIITEDGRSRVPGFGGPSDVVTLKAKTSPVSLRYAYRSGIETQGDPIFDGMDSDTSEYPNLIPYDDGKKLRWGKERKIVQNAFIADITGPVQGFGLENMWGVGENNRTEGECIIYPQWGPLRRVKKTGPDPGIGPDDGDIVDVDIEIGDPLDGPVDGPYTDSPSDVFEDECGPFYKKPINFVPLDILTSEEMSTGIVSFSDNIYLSETDKAGKLTQDSREDNTQPLRGFYRYRQLMSGVLDPREISLENKTIPTGILHQMYNYKTCTLDVLPALRDKDGDIPEPIGPLLSYYMENIRSDIKMRYHISDDDRILKTLAVGSDGYTRFSDGKSYKELLGESVLGCGDLFSFDMIPEVFVEMYPLTENYFVKTYRKKIERPTGAPWIFPDPEYHHDQNHITDIVRDYLTGIPDLDLVTDPFNEGSDTTSDSWTLTPVHLSTLLPEKFKERASFYSKTPGGAFDTKNRSEWWRYVVSRWKGMMRPIYYDIWENDLIKSEHEYNELNPPPSRKNEPNGRTALYDINDETSKYLTTDVPYVQRQTLGDYEMFRRKLGYRKLIYDKIDDAISVKVDFGDKYQSPVSSENPQWEQAFITFLRGNVNIALQTSILPLLLEINNLVFAAITSYSKLLLGDFLGGYASDMLITELKRKGLVGSIDPSKVSVDVDASLQGLLIDLLISVVSSLYTTLKYEYNERENPDRITFSPLRSFKPGGVVLESKSGAYRNLNAPCPIIFLGFNDARKILGSYNSKSKDDILNSLSKDDEESLVYFEPNNMFYANAARSKDVQSMTIMKKRIRKYGVNPLLDIFYLNNPEKSSNHTAVMPFRIGKTRRKEDWPDFTKGQLASPFPPIWNEPATNGVPALNKLGLGFGATYGDIEWSYREKNTILSLKDRWSLSLEEGVDSPRAILKDKTPILDIYNMLMELHIKGISWEEILSYANAARNTIKGPKYNESIDLVGLESLYKTLRARLFEISYASDPQPIIIPDIDFGYIDFGTDQGLIREVEFTNHYRQINPRQLDRISMIIDDINIQPTEHDDIYDDVNVDTYGNYSYEMFEIIDGRRKGGYISAGDSISNPRLTYKFGIKFKNNTNGDSVQPLFEYSGLLKVRGRIIKDLPIAPNEEAETPFETLSLITAKVATPQKLTSTNTRFYNYPLNLPNLFRFTKLKSGESTDEVISFSNLSDSDDVEVVDWGIIENEVSVFDEDTNYFKPFVKPVNDVFIVKDVFMYGRGNNEKENIKRGSKIGKKSETNYDLYGIRLEFFPPNIEPSLTGVKPTSLIMYRSKLVVYYNHYNSIGIHRTKSASKKIIIPIIGISSPT